MIRVLKKYSAVVYLVLAIICLPLAPINASNSLVQNFCSPNNNASQSENAWIINTHCPLCLNLDQPFCDTSYLSGTLGQHLYSSDYPLVAIGISDSQIVYLYYSARGPPLSYHLT